MNRKRVQRLWRDEGLKRPPQGRKRRRVRLDTTERMRALRPNHVWAIDFEFDETTDQRRLKLANIVDECTREALVMRVGRHCTAEDLITELERLVDDLRRTELPALRQRTRAHRQRAARVVSVLAHRDQLHRTRLAVGEPLRRELQRPRPRRTAEHRGVRLAPRSPSRCRSMADRVQHLPTPRRPRRTHPRRSTRRMDHRTPTSTLMTAGPPNGVPSPVGIEFGTVANRGCHAASSRFALPRSRWKLSPRCSRLGGELVSDVVRSGMKPSPGCPCAGQLNQSWWFGDVQL